MEVHLGTTSKTSNFVDLLEEESKIVYFFGSKIRQIITVSTPSFFLPSSVARLGALREDPEVV